MNGNLLTVISFQKLLQKRNESLETLCVTLLFPLRTLRLRKIVMNRTPYCLTRASGYPLKENRFRVKHGMTINHKNEQRVKSLVYTIAKSYNRAMNVHSAIAKSCNGAMNVHGGIAKSYNRQNAFFSKISEFPIYRAFPITKCSFFFGTIIDLMSEGIHTKTEILLKLHCDSQNKPGMSYFIFQY
mgnify:CR=1 FL=1